MKTALISALRYGGLYIINPLVKKGINIDYKLGENLVSNSNDIGLHIVNLLIEKGADINAKNNNGITALMYASMNGHLEIAKLLIEKRADINSVNNYKNTALMYASEYKQLEIAELLVKNNANLIIKSDFNPRLLMITSDKKDFNEITKKIIEISDLKYINTGVNFNNTTALSVAIKASNLEIVKLLIEKGVDIYEKSTLGYNALMYSIQIDSIDIIKYFIEEININTHDDNVLDYLIDNALSYGNVKIIKYLLSKGATLKYTNGNTTSLMLVASSSNVKAVKYIIEYTKEEMKLDIKDYINYKNQSNQTALTYSNYNALNMNKNPKDRDKVVNLLKQYGAE